MNKFKSGDALFIVDPQNDFFSGGALAVPGSEKIIPVINEWVLKAQEAGIPILVSRDWHPTNHCSFSTYGGIWPSHCIQHTKGAFFHSDLKFPSQIIIINKAFTPTAEAYSAFDQGELAIGGALEDYLKQQGIHRLWMGGLALDYCVKATALGAVEKGFEVNLILSATAEIAADSGEAAKKEMIEKGVHFC